ncbi:MAG: tRNA 2-thiocytidine(32) synthetase TtcA [Erysipelotrichaceae bacterium]|nr:tRNA 2-thiocytidine(32) synthetase TtcA [Erysipelotrichaceae bacterium]MBQ5805188.1 tRNA 2-thiocytidine(32) synthetase TtcA [Erysipelotrichaceae bacterium]
MSMKKILAQVRKADQMYQMIENGDRIAVGLSGGKDSSLLLYTLYLYRFLSRNTYQKDFELIGIHIDLNFGEDDTNPLLEWFGQYDIRTECEESKIADILKLNLHKERIDCSLCSTLKKGAVIRKAKELGCNKVAFAHHADDAIETLLMNMIYGGRVATFDPKMYLDHSETTFIRPFCLSFESEIAKTCRQLEIPIIKSGCPNDGYTQRQEIKELLHSIYHKYPQAKENFLLSLYNEEHLNLYFNKKGEK